METRKFSNPAEALEVAKEAVWLAWQACGGAQGMGIFRDDPTAGRDRVWDGAYNLLDYTGKHEGPEGRINADYVFGRMMKLRFKITGDSIEFPDFEPRWDYQSWCHRYKTFGALFDAAANVVVKAAA